MITETTPIPQIGSHPTPDDLTTTHTHPPRFDANVYQANDAGWVTRTCIGGCTTTGPPGHHLSTTATPAT